MQKHISAENPLGIITLDHLEYTASSLTGPLSELFYTLGMQKSWTSDTQAYDVYTQGQIRFVINADTAPHSHARKYFNNHGEGVSTMSFLVENVEQALEEATRRGAKAIRDIQIDEDQQGKIITGAIQGFGDVANEFVERPATTFRPGLRKIDSDPAARALKVRCSRIDHLTNNVPKGQMEYWVEFYQRVYGFKVTRYFDIKGLKTGLLSKVVQSANNQIIIPINEPDTSTGKSQIQEFLDVHKGPGVQHVALMTPNIMSTIEELHARGIRTLDVPHTYYEMIPARGFNLKEDLKELERLQLLVDGDSEGHLLQTFTHNYIGPAFFEFIERHNHWGFGEGNFQALFDSIERDQLKRGYLK